VAEKLELKKCKWGRTYTCTWYYLS